MTLVKTVFQILVLVVTSTFLLPASGDFAFSGSSASSLVISNQRSEDSRAYYLTIHIEGIKSTELKVLNKGKTLYVSAQKGGVVSANAIAGAQIVNYQFDFNENADMKKLSRSNKQNKVMISIPKK